MRARGTAKRSCSGRAVPPARRSLCSSRRGCVAPTGGRLSSVFLLAAALIQLQPSRIFTKFLHQMQRFRSLQVWIGLRVFAALQDSDEVLVRHGPSIARGGAQIIDRNIAGHSQATGQPVTKALITDIDRDRSRARVLIQAAES